MWLICDIRDGRRHLSMARQATEAREPSINQHQQSQQCLPVLSSVAEHSTRCVQLVHTRPLHIKYVSLRLNGSLVLKDAVKHFQQPLLHRSTLERYTMPAELNAPRAAVKSIRLHSTLLNTPIAFTEGMPDAGKKG